jgi:hypothetical protein
MPFSIHITTCTNLTRFTDPFHCCKISVNVHLRRTFLQAPFGTWSSSSLLQYLLGHSVSGSIPWLWHLWPDILRYSVGLALLAGLPWLGFLPQNLLLFFAFVLYCLSSMSLLQFYKVRIEFTHELITKTTL